MSTEDVEWPVEVHGVLETVITTRQPDGCWNAAALGITGPNPVTARTWGQTRTRVNLAREGKGVVQFVTDPVVFVSAALEIVETTSPVLDAACATVEVTAIEREAGRTKGSSWVDWELVPESTTVTDRRVPVINRGFNAVIEASVAASRLSVAAYDTTVLLERIDWLEAIVDRCGSDRDQEAFATIMSHTASFT